MVTLTVGGGIKLEPVMVDVPLKLQDGDGNGWQPNILLHQSYESTALMKLHLRISKVYRQLMKS